MVSPAVELRSILRWHLLIALAVSAVAYGLGGRSIGVSALWGGGIAYAGTFASMIVVLLAGARSPLGALGAQLVGEGLRILLTIVAFWLALRQPGISAPVLLVAFVLTLLGFFAGPLLSRQR